MPANNAFEREDAYRSYTGIEVTTTFFPTAFLLLFCTPVIAINGKRYRRKWGTHFIPLEPGDYTVDVYFPWIFSPRCGFNYIDVRVREGTIKRLKYWVPPWLFLGSSLRLVGTAETPSRGGVSPILWPILFLVGIPVLFLTPFLCCCGFGFVGSFAGLAAGGGGPGGGPAANQNAAAQQWEQEQENARRHQEQAEAARREADKKVADAKARFDRTDRARRFMNDLFLQKRIDDAYQKTSADFHHRMTRDEFKQFVKDKKLDANIAVPGAEDNPEGAESSTHEFTLNRLDRTKTNVKVKMVRQGDDWVVDQVTVE